MCPTTQPHAQKRKPPINDMHRPLLDWQLPKHNALIPRTVREQPRHMVIEVQPNNKLAVVVIHRHAL